MSHSKGKRAALWVVGLGVIVLLGSGFALRADAIEQWYLWKLDSSLFTERFRGAKKLGELRSIKAIPKLVDLLSESMGHDKEAREVWGPKTNACHAVAEVLGELGDPAIPALAQALEESRHQREYWRRAAIRALADTNADDAVAPLIRLVDDDYSCVRLQAMGILGDMGAKAKAAIPALTAKMNERGKNTYPRTAERAIEKIQAATMP